MSKAKFEIALKKGEVGERIVKGLLEEKGWVVYRPETPGPHHFDMLCTKDKRVAIAIDVKAKSRMNMGPVTGINQKSFDEYVKFSEKHNMDFWIFFVDEGLGQVYGNRIKELEKPYTNGEYNYPMVMRNGIRIWHLDSMKVIADLSPEEMQELAGLSQRNYHYDFE